MSQIDVIYTELYRIFDRRQGRLSIYLLHLCYLAIAGNQRQSQVTVWTSCIEEEEIADQYVDQSSDEIVQGPDNEGAGRRLFTVSIGWYSQGRTRRSVCENRSSTNLGRNLLGYQRTRKKRMSRNTIHNTEATTQPNITISSLGVSTNVAKRKLKDQEIVWMDQEA